MQCVRDTRGYYFIGYLYIIHIIRVVFDVEQISNSCTTIVDDLKSRLFLYLKIIILPVKF